jgi:hypothetical protein
MAAGKYAAVFRGDGLEEAEKRIKSDEPKYCCQADGAGGMEMPGLAWRWSSLPHRRGQIMSLLVQAKSEPHGKVYDEFLEALGGIFKGRLDDANPVNLDWRRYDDIADCLRDEYRFPRDRVARSRLARLVERATIRLKYRLKAFNLGPTHYDDSMRTHADHSKFDGTLRMLLDCSDHEMVQIHAYLEMRRAVGELCYGMHLADTAVMMCYASDLKNDPHTHFIDGGGGGYAMAARQLKQQLHVNAPVIDLQPRPAEPAPEAPEAGEPETSKKPTAPNFA